MQSNHIVLNKTMPTKHSLEQLRSTRWVSISCPSLSDTISTTVIPSGVSELPSQKSHSKESLPAKRTTTTVQAAKAIGVEMMYSGVQTNSVSASCSSSVKSTRCCCRHGEIPKQMGRQVLVKKNPPSAMRGPVGCYQYPDYDED